MLKSIGGSVFDQAVRDGLDMDERIPIVDLSGMVDKAGMSRILCF